MDVALLLLTYIPLTAFILAVLVLANPLDNSSLLIGLTAVSTISASVLWLRMLYDWGSAEFSSRGEKLKWFLWLLFTYYVGATLYYFYVKRKSHRTSQ